MHLQRDISNISAHVLHSSLLDTKNWKMGKWRDATACSTKKSVLVSEKEFYDAESEASTTHVEVKPLLTGANLMRQPQ